MSEPWRNCRDRTGRWEEPEQEGEWMPQAQAGPSSAAAAAAAAQPQEAQAFDLDDELTALEADTKVGSCMLCSLLYAIFKHAWMPASSSPERTIVSCPPSNAARLRVCAEPEEAPPQAGGHQRHAHQRHVRGLPGAAAAVRPALHHRAQRGGGAVRLAGRAGPGRRRRDRRQRRVPVRRPPRLQVLLGDQACVRRGACSSPCTGLL